MSIEWMERSQARRGVRAGTPWTLPDPRPQTLRYRQSRATDAAYAALRDARDGRLRRDSS
jgi:hypothetical protein